MPFWGRKLSAGIWKIVGRLNPSKQEFGGIAAVAYGFDASLFSPAKARKWLTTNAAGIAAGAIHKRHSLAFRYDTEENDDGTLTFRDVMVMDEGVWNETHWGSDEFAAMERNAKELGDRMQPPFKVEHVWSGPRWGTLSKPYVADGKLYVEEVAHVPYALAEMIEQKQFSLMSPEILTDWTEPKSQKVYDYVLAGLAVLGVQAPAQTTVPGLAELSDKPPGKMWMPLAHAADIPNETELEYRLFEIDGDDEPNTRSDTGDDKGDDDMDPKELETMKADLQALKDQAATQSAKLEEQSKALDTERAAMAEDMRGMVLAAAVNKLPPDKIDELKERIAEMEMEALRGQLDLLRSLPDIAAGMPTGKGGQPNVQNEDDNLPANMKFEKLCEKVVEERKVDLDEAAGIVGREHPELVKAYKDQFKAASMPANPMPEG